MGAPPTSPRATCPLRESLLSILPTSHPPPSHPSAQVVYVTSLARTWHVMTQASCTMLSCLTAANAANICWRLLAPAHQAKWSCLPGVAMRSLTLGLGMAALTMRAQLDESGPPLGAPATSALGTAAETLVVLARLLFASLAPFMLLFYSAWRLRLG